MGGTQDAVIFFWGLDPAEKGFGALPDLWCKRHPGGPLTVLASGYGVLWEEGLLRSANG